MEADHGLIDPNESEHVYDRGSVNIAPTKFNGRQMDALTSSEERRCRTTEVLEIEAVTGCDPYHGYVKLN